MTASLAISTMAQTNRIFIEDFEIEPGTTDSVPVMLTSVDPSRGVQFNVTLPAGLSYKGSEVTGFSSDNNMRLTYNYNRKDNCYSVFIYPPGRYCYPADTTVAVAYIWLQASNDFKGGTIITWKCRGSTIDNNTIYMDGDTTMVTVPTASLIGIPYDMPVQDQYFNLMGRPVSSPDSVPVAIQVTNGPNGERTSRKEAVGH